MSEPRTLEGVTPFSDEQLRFMEKHLNDEVMLDYTPRLLATIRSLQAQLDAEHELWLDQEKETDRVRVQLEELQKPDRLWSRWKNVGAVAKWDGRYLQIEIGDVSKDWPEQDRRPVVVAPGVAQSPPE